MIARPPPSYEWTLHPDLTDYGAVSTLFGHTYAVFAVGFATLIFRIQPPFFVLRAAGLWYNVKYAVNYYEAAALRAAGLWYNVKDAVNYYEAAALRAAGLWYNVKDAVKDAVDFR